MYVAQLEGFEDNHNVGKVCNLHKSICGLNQTSRSWNLRFGEAIKKFGFQRNVEESCEYKKVSWSITAFLLCILDDILHIGTDIPMLESVKT